MYAAAHNSQLYYALSFTAIGEMLRKRKNLIYGKLTQSLVKRLTLCVHITA